MEVRKWSVRKMRRRPRSCDKLRRKKGNGILKNVDEASETSESGFEGETSAESSQKSESLKRRTSVLLFGNDLDKESLDDAIDLSSDQESTEGEEEQTVGMYIEPTERLCSN